MQIIENITSTFKSVFEYDQNGETTLEIVKSISNFIKSKSYNLFPEVMDIFLNLKFSEGISDVNVFAPNQQKVPKKKVSNISFQFHSS